MMDKNRNSGRDVRRTPAPPASRAPARSASPTIAVTPVPAAVVKAGVPQGATEAGWLPDFVYTGGKFEAGLAFFADALGRITRFSRELADLAVARRLAGQAALPGLINTHSISWQRALRGRAEQRARAGADPLGGWREAHDRIVARLDGSDIFAAARMAFTEMLLAGITCVGEFHALRNQPDGQPYPEPNFLAEQILRAAHEVGIRIALFNVAVARGGHGAAAGPAPVRFTSAGAEAFLRETEALRAQMASRYQPDEAWLGVAPESLASVPLDFVKAIATYAHAQRMRLQMPIALRREEVDACVAEYGRAPIALLAEHGVVDKRFTAVHAIHLGDDDVKLLGAARATVCPCVGFSRNLALGLAPVEKLLAAGAGIALGSGGPFQINLLEDARQLEFELRAGQRQRPALGPDAAATLLHAATTTGARSLGATGGALEVGRPADFFTVNIYDTSIAGAGDDATALLANVMFALERRAIREVWIGARQRIVNGRHPNQGPIVGAFVDSQRRLWTAT